MKRLFLPLFTMFVVATTGFAHAGTVTFQFINKTPLSFDYSLQLANQDIGTGISNLVTVGKENVQRLTTTPSIGPQQASHWQSYQVSSHTGFDLIAFNMMTPDGQTYGLRRKTLKASAHYCLVSNDFPGANMTIVLEQDPRDAGLKLREYTPDGDVCTFGVTQGYGPSLDGR